MILNLVARLLLFLSITTTLLHGASARNKLSENWENIQVSIKEKSVGNEENRKNLFDKDPGQRPPKASSPFKFSAAFEAPTSVDWREAGVIPPVKDQKSCGSCWAFAAIGALEAHMGIYFGVNTTLSEQNLIDCLPSLGCFPFGVPQDTWLTIAYQYILDNGGVDTSESYPQEPYTGNCSYHPENKGAGVVSYATIPTGDEEEMKNVVANVGPVAVTIYNVDNNWDKYTSGVYYNPDCKSNAEDLTHAVVVVGYGTEDEQDFWLVRNSYGADYGDHGYIKMARNRDNNCGIATAASYPIV